MVKRHKTIKTLSRVKKKNRNTKDQTKIKANRW